MSGVAAESSKEESIGASPASGCLIWQRESEWKITAGGRERSIPAGESEERIAAEVESLLQASGGRDRRCVWAVPSTECFFAELDGPEWTEIQDREGMIFELERVFPLDAEAMAADFFSDKKTGRHSAIAVQSDRHLPLVEHLESRDLEVVSVVPSALLIARGLLRSREMGSEFDLVLRRSDELESLRIDNDGVWKWSVFSDSAAGMELHRALAGDDSGGPMVAVGCEPLPWADDRSVRYVEEPAGHWIIGGADELLSGRWGRWIELRRGPLAPSDPLRAVAKPLRLLALAAAFCFVCIALAASFRGSSVAAEIDRTQEEQRLAFRKAFPGRRLPVLMMRTVRSEHAKALGSRGKGDDVQLPVPATFVIAKLFEGLEKASGEKVRFRMLDADVIDGTCTVTIRVREAVAVGAVARSLELVGFDVEPPASEQIEPSREEPMATYQSTITAVWRRTGDAGGDA